MPNENQKLEKQLHFLQEWTGTTTTIFCNDHFQFIINYSELTMRCSQSQKRGRRESIPFLEDSSPPESPEGSKHPVDSRW